MKNKAFFSLALF